MTRPAPDEDWPAPCNQCGGFGGHSAGCTGHKQAPSGQQTDPWRQAVDEALIAHALDCTGPGDDPKEKVKELIEWAVTIATDPRVAEQAVTAAREQEASATGAEPMAWQDVHDHTNLYYRKPVQGDVRPLYATPTTSTTASEFPRRIVALLQEVAEGPFEDGNGECLMEDAKKALAWLANGEKNV